MEFNSIFKSFIYSILLLFCYYLITGLNLGRQIYSKISDHLSFNSVLIWAARSASRLNHTRYKAQIHSASLFKKHRFILIVRSPQDSHVCVNTRVYTLILVRVCPFDCSVDHPVEIRTGSRYRWPELRPSDQMDLVASPHYQEPLCHIWLKIDTVIHRV